VSSAPVRRLAWRFVVSLVLCVAAVAALVVLVNRAIDDEVAKLPRVDVNLVPASSSGVNYLIVGSDSRAFVGDNAAADQAFGNESDTGPPKSDTLMVLHVDGTNSYAVSFPRDLWVDVPGHGKAKINSALNEGPQNVVDTLQKNFDLEINHYVQVDFQSFKTIVDAIGGIRVWIPHAARDDYTNFNVVGAGCWPLDGDRALGYVRSRAPYYQYLIDGEWVQADPVPDIGRIQRQQAFVKKLTRLAIDKVLDDPTSAPSLADSVVPDLTVDRGFDRAALNQLARSLMKSHDGEGITFDTLPWNGGRADGQDVLLVDTQAAKPVLDRLKGLAPIAPSTSSPTDSTSAPSVRPSDVRVRVLNASGKQGAASDAMTQLTSLGFVDGGVGNDPRGLVDHAEVRYAPGSEAKAKLVAPHVPGADLVSDNTLSGSDVIVVLGRSSTGIETNPTGTGTGAGTGASATTTTAPPALTPEQQCEAS
jgi:LCP family protein required for cell wall assembly